MARRASRSGRSTKKSSSKRPRLSSSGGSRVTSLAVATTNTALRRSCSQVEKEPRSRAARASPPCPGALPAKPFSISSTHSATGAMASADSSARASPSSAPSPAPSTRGRSSRRSGTAEQARHRLGGERLPAPLHAEEHDAARRR